MINTDPLTEAQIKATNIVKLDSSILDMDKIRLFMIFAEQPRLVTGFLATQDTPELRAMYIDNLLK